MQTETTGGERQVRSEAQVITRLESLLRSEWSENSEYDYGSWWMLVNGLSDKSTYASSASDFEDLLKADPPASEFDAELLAQGLVVGRRSDGNDVKFW